MLFSLIYESRLIPSFILSPLHQLLNYDIGGKLYNMSASMFENNVLQIETGSSTLSDRLLAAVGVKQGDNLSPSIFNLHLNNFFDALNKDVCDPLS